MKYDFPMLLPIVLDRLYNKWSIFFGGWRAKVLAWWWGIKIGPGSRIQGRAIVRTRHKGEITLGHSVVLNADFTTNLVGIVQATILDTTSGGRISIGNFSGATSPVIHSRSSVSIGNHVKIGGNVRIFDHDFHALDATIRASSSDRLHVRSRPIIIGDDCFIGTNAIILKGTNLGARTIVAAGSVVFGLQTPPDSFVKGNPAVIVERHS